jgi:hypothetical protein
MPEFTQDGSVRHTFRFAIRREPNISFCHVVMYVHVAVFITVLITNRAGDAIRTGFTGRYRASGIRQ